MLLPLLRWEADRVPALRVSLCFCVSAAAAEAAKDLLPLLRFGTMRADDFAAKVIPCVPWWLALMRCPAPRLLTSFSPWQDGVSLAGRGSGCDEIPVHRVRAISLPTPHSWL
jgi:hypothetical protein